MGICTKKNNDKIRRNENNESFFFYLYFFSFLQKISKIFKENCIFLKFNFSAIILWILNN